ncbi:MAG: hypothetical protein ABJH63_02185 [Rhizobiaceae bacterium]
MSTFPCLPVAPRIFKASSERSSSRLNCSNKMSSRHGHLVSHLLNIPLIIGPKAYPKLTYINAVFSEPHSMVLEGKKMRILGTFLLFWVVAACSPCQSEAQNWQTYKNARFGFHFKFPTKNFAPVGEAANNDGQVFETSDGQAQIVAYGSYNALEHTPKSYLQWMKAESSQLEEVTYERAARDWIVVSGFVGQNVYYQKTIFSCFGEVMNSLVLVYPISQKPIFDPMVGPIAKSLSPGLGYGTPTDCR